MITFDYNVHNHTCSGWVECPVCELKNIARNIPIDPDYVRIQCPSCSYVCKLVGIAPSTSSKYLKGPFILVEVDLEYHQKLKRKLRNKPYQQKLV